MGAKIKYFVIILVAGIEYITLRSWLVCKAFTDVFHHSSVDLKLQLLDYVHTEKGTSLLLTRLFNNKFDIGFFDYVRFYLQFWDIRFGSIWFSLIGYVGILFGFYYLFSEKKKTLYHWIALVIILILPLIEIIIEPHVSILIKSSYLWLPFILFSLYGSYQFLSHGNLKKRLIIICAIVLLSILWLAFLPNDMPRYCVK
jgi:hypothetical protein